MLLDSTLKNQNEIFGLLYHEHQAKVYRLALSLAGNSHDAEEITQEAFYRAFRSYHTFQNKSSFFTWIYRITLNVAKDHIKYRSKLPIQTIVEDLGYSFDQIIDTNPMNNPETQLLLAEAKYRCLHCLTECLPLKQRQVFCLAITLDLPLKLVAEILECTVNSVKTTLFRAKQRWKGYMENRCVFIKKSNPCHCEQWVRFGLSQGWITKDTTLKPRPLIKIQTKEEIIKLQDLRNIYQNLYHEKADETFTERVREGIKKNEWAIFS